MFTEASVLSGRGGMVTLYVQDDANKLIKDVAKLELLNGQPAKVAATCSAFKEGDVPDGEG